MSTAGTQSLEEVIRQSGEGWLIDWFAPRERAMAHICKTLDDVSHLARQRLGGSAPMLSEASLVREYGRHPSQVRAFFQALGGTRTPEMLLMVWRIIQGMEIKEVQVSYVQKKSFDMRVILSSPYGEQDEPYESKNIHDFALLGHIGSFEISGKPVFDGFYAMRFEER